jgi:phage tail-like protein
MRGMVPGLATPHPLGRHMPSLYQQEDRLVLRLLEALDEVTAPVHCTLDSLEAYFDPLVAPTDFLEWLATWLGVEFDEAWSEERRREVLASASATYRMLGTAAGLRAALTRFVDGRVEVEESGGAAWSDHSGGELPGRPDFELVVRIRAADPSSVPVARLDAMVAAVKPAHIVHRIEVTGVKG